MMSLAVAIEAKQKMCTTICQMTKRKGHNAMSLITFAGFYCSTQDRAENSSWNNKFLIIAILIVAAYIAGWHFLSKKLAKQSKAVKIITQIFLSIVFVLLIIGLWF